MARHGLQMAPLKIVENLPNWTYSASRLAACGIQAGGLRGRMQGIHCIHPCAEFLQERAKDHNYYIAAWLFRVAALSSCVVHFFDEIGRKIL